MRLPLQLHDQRQWRAVGGAERQSAVVEHSRPLASRVGGVSWQQDTFAERVDTQQQATFAECVGAQRQDTLAKHVGAVAQQQDAHTKCVNINARWRGAFAQQQDARGYGAVAVAEYWRSVASCKGPVAECRRAYTNCKDGIAERRRAYANHKGCIA